jgi:group I intron endonuclease
VKPIHTMGYIYKIVNKIDNKIYIGQTIHDCETRWKHHQSKGSNCRYLSSVIKKYGVDNFEFKLVCITFDNKLDEMEIDYIKQYNCLVPNGYNLRLGGNSGRHNIETKQKISDTLKTKFANGMIPSKPQLGKPHNKITKKKISDRLKGRKVSKESREKGIETLRMKRNRKIIQLDIHGNRLNEFDSCKEAGEYVGTSKSNISMCCHGKAKTSKGYIWKYESIVE